MPQICQKPLIYQTQPDEDVIRLYFNPAEVNPDSRLYRDVAEDLNLQSGGAITVLLGYLSSGWIEIYQNPAMIDTTEISHCDAAAVMAHRLKEACATGPDFNPDLFPPRPAKF